MFQTPCVILAGGKSSRMGQDKSKLPFGGFNTLCEYQISRLKPLFKSLHVSTKEDKFDFKVDLILDEKDKPYSPMVALEKILSTFSDTHVFILSVDTPFITQKEIEKLYLHINDFDVVIPQTSSYSHQLCGFYSTSLASTCKELALKDIHKIKELYKSLHVKYVNFDDEKPFVNLNYMDEYKQAYKSFFFKSP